MATATRNGNVVECCVQPVAVARGSVFYDLTGADAAMEISSDVLAPIVITSKDPTTRDTAYGLFGDLVSCVCRP